MKTTDNKFRIFIDKNGNWFQDGLKITHHWTYLENNKNLDVDENDNFFVDEGHGRVYVEVEDTPFVVKMINLVEGKYFIHLNDKTVEELNPVNVTICETNVPYTIVKNGKFKARFTSQAYYEFAKNIVQDEDGFYISTKDGNIRIDSELN